MRYASNGVSRAHSLRYLRGVHGFHTCRRDFLARPSERVEVACQSNGKITLDVHYPLRGTEGFSHGARVLIYLPRGPYLFNEEDETSALSTLKSHLNCPIVQINYRLGKDSTYPTPIHDVLHGYDWVKENLLPTRAISRPGRSERLGKLAVWGELIGGGLATMLALTECRVGEPGIVALATNNPLVDWVSLEGTVKARKRVSKKVLMAQTALQPDLTELRTLRSQLFTTPGDYFDPFASPVLFLRSAGVPVPAAPQSSYVPHDDLAHLSMLEREASDSIDYEPAPSSSSESEDASFPAMRKVSRRFPSKSLGLKLPSFHMTSGLGSPLHNQNLEMVTLLRKSIAREVMATTSTSSDFGNKVLLEDELVDSTEAESVNDVESLRWSTCDSMGLWDCSKEGKERVVEMASWINKYL